MNERANDYVREWLGAYLDGELSADRRAWVEEHLASCQACQRELVELRALSTLLHADPVPTPFLDQEMFSRQVVSRLPKPAPSPRQRALQLGLRYLPLGLFGAWAFVQAALLVSTVLLYALNLFPQAGGLLAGLAPVPESAAGGWIGGLMSLSGLSGLSGLAEESGLSILFNPLTLISLAAIALLAVLFFAWLAGLWTYHRSQAQKPV